jgi:chromosome segregation ATPase
LGQINMLKSQVVGLKKEHEMVQRNLVAVVDKETKLGRESASLQEQIKAAECVRQELAQQLQVVQRQRDAKHQQLEETVQLNHRLGGQVRFLAAKAFETMDQGPAGAVGANKKSGDGLLRLPEFAAFEKKVEQAVSEVCSAEMKKKASVGESQQGAVETEAEEAVATAAKRDVLPAALQRSLEVVYSCFLASRVELRLSTKQNAQCEQRIAEQQLTIESLQHSLATIEREVQTASGSADHLKRQVQDPSADLASHKLRLAIAERSLAQRSGELTEAREEISALQDSLAASGAARADLVELCSEYSAGAESRAADYVRALTERVLLEREEMLTRLAVVRLLFLLVAATLVLFLVHSSSSRPHPPHTQGHELGPRLPLCPRRQHANRDAEVARGAAESQARRGCSRAGSVLPSAPAGRGRRKNRLI